MSGFRPRKKFDERFERRENVETRGPHPLEDAFRFLADNFPVPEENDQGNECIWKGHEYIFPYSNADTKIALADYRSNIHYNVFTHEAQKKVMYTRSCSPAEANDFEVLLKSKIQSMCESLSLTCERRIDIDIMKLVLFYSDLDEEDISTIGELESHLEQRKVKLSTIVACFPSGPSTLLGILESLGAVLTKEEEGRQWDIIRCICWRQGFKYRNRIFNGSLVLNGDDLVFSDWERSDSFSQAICLTTPVAFAGSCDDDEDVVCDLRIKTKFVSPLKVADDCTSEDLLSTLENEAPPELTRPGLNGLVRRGENGEGFSVVPNTPIDEILDTSNSKRYRFDFEGVDVTLATSDKRAYKILRNGTCNLFQDYECWPRLMFWVKKEEEDLPRICELVTKCVVTLMSALSERRLEARPCKLFYFRHGYGANMSCPSPTALLMKRISQNDNLDAMLSVRGETNKRVLRFHLKKALRELESVINVVVMTLENPKKLKQKLIEAALENGIDLE